jgi:hypothetical protein
MNVVIFVRQCLYLKLTKEYPKYLYNEMLDFSL